MMVSPGKLLSQPNSTSTNDDAILPHWNQLSKEYNLSLQPINQNQLAVNIPSLLTQNYHIPIGHSEVRALQKLEKQIIS